MLLRKQLFVLLFIILILSISAFPTFATSTPPTFLDATFYCDTILLTYIPGSYGAYNVRVLSSEGVVSSELTLTTYYTYPAPTDPVTVAIPLDPTQEEGTLLIIQYENFGISWIKVASGNCAGLYGDISEPATPAYYQFGGKDAYMGMRFITEVEENPILVLLDISNDSEGTVMFYIAASTLEEEYPCTGETYPIFQTADKIHQFHRLSTCEFQLTTGPDFEGKTHILIFEGLPPQNIHQFTFVTIGYIHQSNKMPF